MTKYIYLSVTVFLCAAAESLWAGPQYFLVPSGLPSIQAAIDSNDCNDGDFIIVSDGPNDGAWDANEGFYDIDFRGKAVTVQSSGGAQNCIIRPPAGYQAFRFQNGEDGNSVVDGFTIENAQVTGNGGAFSFLSSSPTIKNCVIKNNSADYGAGIYCQSSSPLITDCTIMANSAVFGGGGIYADSSSSPVITNCTISGNQAAFGGGGIYADSSSSPVITNCIISGNQAAFGGGIYCLLSSLTITDNCKITDNVAQSTVDDAYGGGIYCDSSSLVIDDSEISKNRVQSDYYSYGGAVCITQSSDVTITNSTISDNWVLSDYEVSYGGAIYCEFAPLSIADCVIFNNSADYGGAISCYDVNSLEISFCIISNNSSVGAGGGLNLVKDCAGKITNSVIVGNTGSYGGGIECDWQSSPVIKNCIISGNEAYYYTGGGIDCYASSPSIINCTISSNYSPLDNGGGINCEADASTGSEPLITNCIFENNGRYAIYEFDEYSDPCLTYCLFFDNTPGIGGVYGDYWDDDTYRSYVGTADSNDGNSIDNIPDGLASNNKGQNPLFVMDGLYKITGVWAAVPNEPNYEPNSGRTTLTDETAVFDVNALAGKFINTNVSQRRQVLITANTATTIEVAGDVTSYTAGGHTYKIIDYHISIGSPCVQTGDPNFAPDSNAVDIDDEPRIIANHVEIGVDEMAIYRDGLDFFVSHWLDSPCSGTAGDYTDWCYGTDIDKDGIVNFEDFAKIAENWLGTVP